MPLYASRLIQLVLLSFYKFGFELVNFNKAIFFDDRRQQNKLDGCSLQQQQIVTVIITLFRTLTW